MRRKQLIAIFAIAPAILLGLLILSSTVYGATPGSPGKEGKAAGTNPSAPSALNTQGSSASAYSSANTEFLVVWEDARNGGWDIYGQRVDADGTMLGTNFAIANTSEFEQDVSIAYNSSAANEYLVVWASDDKILGQRVSATGTLTGGAFEISSGTLAKDDPAIAYSAGDNQYLVVWEEFLQGQMFNMRGRRVASDGTPQASVIDIATANGYESDPVVSYSTLTKEFLVAYRLEATSIYSIKARRVTGTGTVQPSTINVSSGTTSAHDPSIGYNTNSHDWMVVWTDLRGTDADIYAQMVETDGSLIGSNYAINADAEFQEHPHIAYSSAAAKYLVVFQSFGPNNFEIRAQVVSTGGGLSGDDMLVSTGPDREYYPFVTTGAGSALFLVTFDDDRQGDTDLFAQRFDSNAALVGENFPVAPIPYLINTPTPIITPSPTATPCVVNYSDVPQGSTFYEFVRCLSCRNVLSGYPDNTFRPGNNVTRAQLAKIVSNAAGFNETPNQQLFEDVPPGDTFYEVVYRLATNGAISGYPCNSIPTEPCVGPNNRPYFRPGNNATRGQIAKIVFEAADNGIRFSPAGGQTFEDVPPSNPFHTYIEALSQDGIMSGYPCNSTPTEPCVGPNNRPYFRPGNNATRGQVAKIVNNTFFPNCEEPIDPGH
ncbi:MAG: S-layer homology domain-containing protein [Chloroflexota bacterium]|nr:S-layer homology domain-containing protein [Chloroflexota bacterium]